MWTRLFIHVVLLAATALAAGVAHADPMCQKISEVCVDGPSTRTISGVNVARDCWR